MSYKSEYTALAWRDAKTAALYFDQVIPANIPDLWRAAPDDPIYYEVLRALLPPSLLAAPSRDNVTGLHRAVTNYVAGFLVGSPDSVGIVELPNGETLEQRAQSMLPQVIQAFEGLIAESRIDDLVIYGETLSPPRQNQTGDPTLVLADLELVDTSKLSWKALLEFRRDPQSKEKLRGLRRFAHQNYIGKSPDFVKEDIQERIEKYKEATRFWGFPVLKGTLKVALSSDAAAALGGVIAVLYGVPATLAALAALPVVLGSATLVLMEQQREVYLAKKHNPLAYLVEAERLETKK